MSRDDEPRPPAKTLRERAEEVFNAPPTDFSSLPPEDIRLLIHELQIHQVELKIQNEELRETQVELAHTRDRYSELYEFAPVGFVTIDDHGVIREANLTAAAMLRIERARLVGAKFSSFVAGESQSAWHVHQQRAFASSSGTQTCELELCLPDESGLTVALHTRAAHGQGGADRRVHTALTDVTDRHAAQAVLEKFNIVLEQSLSDRTGELQRTVGQIVLLSEAISHLSEGIMITEGDLAWPMPDIVYVNEAMCEITGYRAEELIGETPAILLGSDSDPETLSELREALAASRPYRCELTHHHKDGSRYAAELWVSPMPDGARGNRTLITIHRDVTQQRLADEKLRSLYEFNESLIETAQTLILVLDYEGRVVRFNPAFERLSGWLLEEVEGRDWFETFLPARDRERIRERFAIAGSGVPTRGAVNPIVTRSGDERTIEWHDATLRDAGGNLVGLLCSGTDVTERLRLEQEVINAAEEQQQRIASDLHDDLGSLLTSVGLRANSLAGRLAKAADAKLASDGVAITQQVQDAITKTRSIARGLNSMGGHPGDLAGALTELAARVQSEAPLTCRLECPEVVAINDPITANHLFRIAQESVHNAVKYSGGTEITVSLKLADDGLELTISDDGCGFDRAANASPGLGLHIMNYRAAAIGASLTIARGESGGTRVTCRRPRPAPKWPAKTQPASD